mmetsp:Transcript_53265/g.127406  ORF Transcript_53265/g.127406 Transcript_53265/m.127406 type:complete len:259 (-) Transcript_53265:148-924(-)
MASATKSNSDCPDTPSASLFPRSSSSFSSPSGSTTALAPSRAVPRFMALPTARHVLIHWQISSDVLRAVQAVITRSHAKPSSGSSGAKPNIKAPHATFAVHKGRLAKTHKYLSGTSSCRMSDSGMSMCRSCSTASFWSTDAAWRAISASGGRPSGKASRLSTVWAKCSAGGNLLKAMASSWEVLSSSTRTFLRASSPLGLPDAPLRVIAALVSVRAKRRSSNAASNGTGLQILLQMLSSGTLPTVCQKRGLSFGPTFT